MDTKNFPITVRHEKILKLIVEDYIQSFEPVGSRKLSKNSILDLSSATIRNSMADLEDVGLLTHPHTSAGRIPTDHGYKYYIEFLMNPKKLTGNQKKKILNEYSKISDSFSNVIEHASRFLASFSNQVGLISFPELKNVKLKQINFVKINVKRYLVIIISYSGIVNNRIVELSYDLSQDELNSMANYLNEKFADLSLFEIQAKLYKMIQEDKENYFDLCRKALDIGEKVFGRKIPIGFHFDGAINIIDQPEFSSFDKMKQILHTLDDKVKLLEIFEKCFQRDGLQVQIGSEIVVDELKDCSIVTCTYKFKGDVLGVLGILGPTRMHYKELLPFVDYAAELVSKHLSAEESTAVI
jgi:heat-inducible transcriptional repressor